ncbi:MAG TPA: hypothetical protein VFS93_07515 [Terrimesophilobacter sp.]|nr:hypothetical protein [Terrimesophilobacter sp.]
MRTTGSILLLLGSASSLAAAVLPQLYPVWTSPVDEGLRVIRDEIGAWRLCTLLFLVGAGLVLVGLPLVFAAGTDPSRAPAMSAALALATTGTVLWIVNLAFRLSVTVRVAQGLGDAVPDWYLSAWGWVGALWSVAAVLLGIGFAALGLLSALSGSLPAWAGWTSVGVVAVAIGLLIFLQDTPPIVIYLAPVAWGVAVLLLRES